MFVGFERFARWIDAWVVGWGGALSRGGFWAGSARNHAAQRGIR